MLCFSFFLNAITNQNREDLFNQLLSFHRFMAKCIFEDSFKLIKRVLHGFTFLRIYLFPNHLIQLFKGLKDHFFQKILALINSFSLIMC